MYDQEIRWGALIPVSILLGFATLAAEMSGLLPAFPARPDLFWCLAFLAGMRAPPIESLMAFAWCGAVRDGLLGPKMGAAALAFILAGWLVVLWKPLFAIRGWAGRAAAAGLSSLLAALLKHGLDAGWSGIPGRWEWLLVVSTADGLLTALFFLPFVLFMSVPSFRPSREREIVYYGNI